MPSQSDQDAIVIDIGGTSFSNWLEVDLDSDIFAPADAWSLTATMPQASPSADEVRAGAAATPFDSFREGAKLDIRVGDDRQLVGVIDEFALNAEHGEARLQLSGRDLGALLVDSEADSFAVSNYTLQNLIDRLIDPAFGIKSVIDSNEANRELVIGKQETKQLLAKVPGALANPVRKTTKIDPGQSIASIIDEHTKRLGLTWWMTADGSLFVGKPNYNQDVAYEFLVAGPGSSLAPLNNVESWTVTRSIGDRYSEIQVNAQGLAGDTSDVFDGKRGAPKFLGLARDPDLVERGIVRRLVIRDCDAVTQDEAQHHADVEQQRRRLSGLVIKLVVSGFRDDHYQRLYSIDTLASVRIDDASINGMYYVTQRRFREDRGKRRTELTLHEPGVWLP